jgi:Icc-related predicted phosphoesterase
LFYGSPWQPWFLNWAFNLQRGKEIQEKWDLISNDVDVLITHGPAFGILDRNINGENAGCENLLSKIEEIRPKVHVCGHIHEGYGQTVRHSIKFINASVNNERYRPTNNPILFILD